MVACFYRLHRCFIRKLTIIFYDKMRVCIYMRSQVQIFLLKTVHFLFVLESVSVGWCGGGANDMLDLCRNFGLETKSLLMCMTRDLVMLVILISSLQGLTIVVMVNNILPPLKKTLLNSSGTCLNKLS